MICWKCGNQIDESSGFCMFCGAPVRKPGQPDLMGQQRYTGQTQMPQEDETVAMYGSRTPQQRYTRRPQTPQADETIPMYGGPVPQQYTGPAQTPQADETIPMYGGPVPQQYAGPAQTPQADETIPMYGGPVPQQYTGPAQTPQTNGAVPMYGGPNPQQYGQQPYIQPQNINVGQFPQTPAGGEHPKAKRKKKKKKGVIAAVLIAAVLAGAAAAAVILYLNGFFDGLKSSPEVRECLKQYEDYLKDEEYLEAAEVLLEGYEETSDEKLLEQYRYLLKHTYVVSRTDSNDNEETSEYEFDDNGYPTEVVVSYDTGQEDQRTEYEYDDAGNVLSSFTYIDDRMVYGYEYEYDENGKILVEDTYSHSYSGETETVLLTRYEYEYDRQGRMTEEKMSTEQDGEANDGSMIYRYEYDRDGILSGLTVTLKTDDGKSETIEADIEREEDRDGAVESVMAEAEQDGEIVYRYEAEYEDGRMISHCIRRGSSEILYNSAGYMEKLTVFSGDYVVLAEEFDALRQLKKVVQNVDTDNEFTVKFEYEYMYTGD